MDKMTRGLGRVAVASIEALKARQRTLPPPVINYTITAKPVETPNSVFKILCVGCVSMYIGAFVAQYGASFLEENEIFVPTDDDDDD